MVMLKACLCRDGECERLIEEIDERRPAKIDRDEVAGGFGVELPISTDGPLPGSDDATYTRYDAIGRKVWEIGPKGENGLRPATRTTYRIGDDKPLQVETGTVAGATTGTSPTTLVFTELISEVEAEYNTRRLPTKVVVSDADQTS